MNITVASDVKNEIMGYAVLCVMCVCVCVCVCDVWNACKMLTAKIKFKGKVNWAGRVKYMEDNGKA